MKLKLGPRLVNGTFQPRPYTIGLWEIFCLLALGFICIVLWGAIFVFFRII